MLSSKRRCKRCTTRSSKCSPRLSIRLAGLIQLGGVKELTLVAYGFVGFLGGFSEPFVLGILDYVVGRWGSTLRKSQCQRFTFDLLGVG